MAPSQHADPRQAYDANCRARYELGEALRHPLKGQVKLDGQYGLPNGWVTEGEAQQVLAKYLAESTALHQRAYGK